MGDSESTGGAVSDWPGCGATGAVQAVRRIATDIAANTAAMQELILYSRLMFNLSHSRKLEGVAGVVNPGREARVEAAALRGEAGVVGQVSQLIGVLGEVEH